MDIFTQKRTLLWVIILLVLLNLTTLVLVWFGRPHPPERPLGPAGPEQERRHLQQLLKIELGFDAEQTEAYLRLRQSLRQEVRQLEMEIRQIKKQMFDEVLQENSPSMLSDSLLNLAQEKQARIERLTFQHLLDLKRLCNPEQEGKLKRLVHQLFRKGPGDAPPPGRER